MRMTKRSYTCTHWTHMERSLTVQLKCKCHVNVMVMWIIKSSFGKMKSLLWRTDPCTLLMYIPNPINLCRKSCYRPGVDSFFSLFKHKSAVFITIRILDQKKHLITQLGHRKEIISWSQSMQTFNRIFLTQNMKDLLAVVIAGEKQLLKNYAMIRMLLIVHKWV